MKDINRSFVYELLTIMDRLIWNMVLNSRKVRELITLEPIVTTYLHISFISNIHHTLLKTSSYQWHWCLFCCTWSIQRSRYQMIFGCYSNKHNNYYFLGVDLNLLTSLLSPPS
ncbi:hypothetical protein [Candidatus Hodgkinia cicadicola]|uniref:hypothetical protein n=1 Tax=Candidatus Hodgkinia cicadicola TaxID=573658 RepID=UPI0011BA660F